MSLDDGDFNPWGNKDGNKNKPRKTSSNGGKNQGQEPDLDELLQKLQSGANGLFGGGRGGKGKGGKGNGDPRGPMFIFSIVAAIYLIFGSIFLVSPGEEAVILRFGEYNRTVGPGLNFKFPVPFEKGFIEDVQQIRHENIGNTPSESLMVTGDENIVDVQFVVQWRIKTLQDFLFKVRDSAGAVKSAAESAMRETIGNTPASAALGEGEGRTQVEQTTEDLLQTMLDDYGTGIEIIDIQLKPIDVPPQVVDAQIDVQNAKTEQERLKNQAEAYRNDIIPRARGEAEKMLQEAEGYKQRVINEAEGDASRFLAVYKEYKRAKDVTKKRIYLETMQEIMAGMDKIILDADGGVLPYLPVNELKKQRTAE